MITSGSKYRVLASAILCLCPPDKVKPCSPIFESRPFGKLLIKLSKLIFFIILSNFTLSISLALIPKQILFKIVSSIKFVICGT